MYNRNSYFDGKQRYEIRNAETNEVIDGGFTSQKKASARIKELKQEFPNTRFYMVGYKDSERK